MSSEGTVTREFLIMDIILKLNIHLGTDLKMHTVLNHACFCLIRFKGKTLLRVFYVIAISSIAIKVFPLNPKAKAR